MLAAVWLGPAWAGVAVSPLPGLALLAVGVAVAISVTAAYWPARRAARLDPCACFSGVLGRAMVVKCRITCSPVGLRGATGSLPASASVSATLSIYRPGSRLSLRLVRPVQKQGIPTETPALAGKLPVAPGTRPIHRGGGRRPAPSSVY